MINYYSTVRMLLNKNIQTFDRRMLCNENHNVVKNFIMCMLSDMRMNQKTSTQQLPATLPGRIDIVVYP